MMHPLMTDTGYREPLPSLSTRKVAMRSRTSCRGFIPVWLASEQWWRRIVFESQLELMFIQLILSKGNVFDIWEQPPAMPYVDKNGKRAQHFFDFLVTWTDGSKTAWAVKPLELVQRRNFDREVALIASQTPKPFANEVRLFTDAGFQRHDAVNAARFQQLSKTDDPVADAAVASEIAKLDGTITVEQLVKRTAMAGRAYRAVVRAVFRGDLRQIRVGLIDYPTLVKRGVPSC
ncbi:TnsA endonuclease N-terminal domain-containing protein [uncultured Tateyamaria sp.]|uniref:TnsA endonuclease N-terminal domain-containing protein n=1 Tax=uncultured Tateyamaria sp. TaxID=455651 RepID=UPI0026101D60|nr:TnsA endonuclease N-terminal domain-containing protein [uncultured Tateyamaria sp.]